MAIKPLIQVSVGTIEAGGLRTQAAGQTMSQIVSQVDHVVARLAKSTGVTTHQASGVSQVHQAVSAMDRFTRQNAAQVKQSVGAADSLSRRAPRLGETVGIRHAGHIDHDRYRSTYDVKEGSAARRSRPHREHLDLRK